MILLKILGYIATILLIINTVIYAKALSNNGKAFKMFSVYLILICIVEILTKIVGSLLHQNNLFLSHFYFIFQFITLSIFFKILLKNDIIYFLLIMISVCLGYQYLSEPSLFGKYNSIGISLTQGILIVYSLIYLYHSLQSKYPDFLIVNIGIFIYLLTSTLIFASGNLVFNLNIPRKTYFLLLKLNAILYILFQILIFIEWRKNYYKKTLRS